MSYSMLEAFKELNEKNDSSNALRKFKPKDKVIWRDQNKEYQAVIVKPFKGMVNLAGNTIPGYYEIEVLDYWELNPTLKRNTDKNYRVVVPVYALYPIEK